jgi:hypothetical protein
MPQKHTSYDKDVVYPEILPKEYQAMYKKLGWVPALKNCQFRFISTCPADLVSTTS